MQMVYFLLLPMAMMSGAIVGSSFMEPSAGPPLAGGDIGSDQLRSVLLATWMFVGVFALMARWLAWAQQKIVDQSLRDSVQTGQSTTRVPWLFRNRDSLVMWLWCLCQPVGLAATGWAGMVQHKTQSSTWHAGAIALWVLPSLVLLIVLDGIQFSQYHRRMQRQQKRVEPVLRVMWRLSSHSWLMPLAAPLMIALLLDTVRFGAIVLGGSFEIAESDGGFGEVVCLVLVAGCFSSVVLPELFVRCLDVSKADSSLEDEVRSIWAVGRQKVPKVLLWSTRGTAANAAMVGLLGPWKKLLLTDALLERLTASELQLVMMHELSHCRQRHAWIRLLPTIFAVVLAVACTAILSGWPLIAACGMILVLFFVSLVQTCWWTELDADCNAIEIAMRYRSLADWGVHPALHLVSALRNIYGANNLKQRNWLHPSCDQRCRAIEARYSDLDAIDHCRNEFA